MGVSSVLGLDPVKVATAAVGDTADKLRRKNAQRRLDLYCDHAEPHLEELVDRTFEEAKIKKLLAPFLGLAASMSLLRRVVDEIARPVYSTPPTRIVKPEASQEVYRALADEVRLSERMDLACRLVQAVNTVWLYGRFIPSLGQARLDVLTPNNTTVIPHPDDPTTELALIYDTKVWHQGRVETAHVFWDDEVTFRFLADGRTLGGGPHGIGRMPFVAVHRRARWGAYHDDTTGNDLEGGTLAVQLLTALTLRLHKAQGFRQITATGDVQNLPKSQPMGEDTALIGTDVQFGTLDLATPPDHYLKTIEAITTTVAANHGVSRDRLNQKTNTAADEVGLLERRADAIKVFHRAEHDVFELLKLVSREHPTHRIPEEAKLTIDFAEVEARVDRLTQLKIREEEERMGLRSRIDDIMEDQPEVATEEDAWEEYMRNLAVRARRIELERALNMPQEPDRNGPGRSPEDNGRMGPAARDNADEGADAPDDGSQE